MALRSDTYDPRDLLDHLVAVISSGRFLRMESLNNEVPFFICPYDVAHQKDIEDVHQRLLRKLQAVNLRWLDVNLYDHCVEMLRSRGIWDQILEAESDVSKPELMELLQGVLDPEDHLVPAISKSIAEVGPDVMFLTGVGEVFPFLRSHNILNNLQSAAKDFPTVMFFPGRYTHELASGASLDLFGRLHDDKYYRAFNILHVEA